MPHIARLSEDGTLLSVEECDPDDHKTCPIARTVRLDDGHDMHQRRNGYRWDFAQACFVPLSAEPVNAADRDTPDLVEGLIQIVEDVVAHLKIKPSRRARRALAAYRRYYPRPRDPANPDPAIIVDTPTPTGEAGQ